VAREILLGQAVALVAVVVVEHPTRAVLELNPAALSADMEVREEREARTVRAAEAAHLQLVHSVHRILPAELE
jgi:hypothetical protein